MTASVRWQEWGPKAFQRAEREKKPVLLHIGAVWCHWCHVVDHTTYEDPQVVALVNERFVPVRVDNDRRPDVNRRYNMGGWPTTAFLMYADWNAMAARALLRAGRVLAEPRWTRQAQELLLTLDRDLRAADGGMAHFRVWRDGAFEGEPELPGLLSDQVEMADALLALYAETREAWAVKRALELMEYVEQHLAAREGGYFDGPADPAALGALKYRVRPMEENARAARVLLELYQLTGRAQYEERARKALATHTKGLERTGSLGAVFGLALEALLRPVHVVLVGPVRDGVAPGVAAAAPGSAKSEPGASGVGGLGALKQAVQSFPLSTVSLSVQDTAGPNPHDPLEVYPGGDRPLAYVCVGTTCLAPVGTAEELGRLLRETARGTGTGS